MSAARVAEPERPEPGALYLGPQVAKAQRLADDNDPVRKAALDQRGVDEVIRRRPMSISRHRLSSLRLRWYTPKPGQRQKIGQAAVYLIEHLLDVERRAGDPADAVERQLADPPLALAEQARFVERQRKLVLPVW